MLAASLRRIGPVQHLILSSLIRLGPDVSATALQRHLAHRAGQWLHLQQIHTALDRLEARGYATSWRRGRRGDYLPWWRRPGPRHPWAPRRLATATTLGRRALRLTALPGDWVRHGLPGLGHEDQLYRQYAPRLPWSPREVAADLRVLAGVAARRAAFYGRRRRLRWRP